MSLYETAEQDNHAILKSRQQSAEIERLSGVVEQQKHILTTQTKLLARIQHEAEKLYHGQTTLTAFMAVIKPGADIEL